ncbi:MAG: zinc ribbon domain-containing protein [Spirochaetales bacterium]|nr:zinc ribbon domain-containing protein [Spirochaetales bacterium]
MPTYEYQCENCEYHFEKLQSIKDEPLTQCPQCQGKVKRLIGGGLGVIFKGSGFYTTDYKRSSATTGTGTTASTISDTTKTASSDKKDSGSKDKSAKASA